MKEVDVIDLRSIKSSTTTKFKLNMVENALGEPWQIPVVVIRGKFDGPVLGVTAALHGNELNGIPIIHSLIKKIDHEHFHGTLIAIPILNIPGFLNGEREFNDNKDLNRLMPGRPKGSSSEVYAHYIVNKIGKKLDYLIDLHTASFGRINSLYVRADLKDPVVARMAKLQDPQIIVNSGGEKGTFRQAVTDHGVKAITVEVGDPHVFQRKHIRPSIFGITNVLVDLNMIDDKILDIEHEPLVCKKSFWIYAQSGGILRVLPTLTDLVKKGEVVATITDIFGELIEEIKVPEDSVVVAKSTNPVCQVGSRVLHIGIEWENYKTKKY
jgi:hypothetical protein